MSITANVTSSPIAASVSGSTIAAAVSSSIVSVTTSGGIGPQGPSGSTGETGGASTLAELTDVQITSAAEGDVLRYNGSKWADHAEINLTDGGSY